MKMCVMHILCSFYHHRLTLLTLQSFQRKIQEKKHKILFLISCSAAYFSFPNLINIVFAFVHFISDGSPSNQCTLDTSNLLCKSNVSSVFVCLAIGGLFFLSAIFSSSPNFHRIITKTKWETYIFM